VNRLIFSNTATIAGSANNLNSSATLQINNGLTHTANNSGNSFMRIQTVALGGNQTWNLNGTNGLNNNGANGFTIVPNGVATVANTFNLNGYTLTKTGSGQVVLGGVTIGDGSIDINEGSVRFATFGTATNAPLTTVGGTGAITVKGGAAVLFAVGSNAGRFNVTKPIRMEGTVGSPSTMQTNGSLTVSGTIASPIEWAGVSNLEHYWAVGTNRRFEFTGNWTGSGTVSTVLTSTTAPAQESVITLSGSNGGFGGLVDNVYSGTGAGVSWVQFGSANAGSANAEWKLSNANASYRLNGLSVSLGALSGTAGTLSNGGLNAGIGAAVATIGGKGIDTTFSGLITDGSAALSVVKTGAGTLTLDGTSSYTGGTTVSAGKLHGTTSGIQGAITNNAAVEFSQATSGTYAGIMSGSGSLTKTGAGSVTLAGINTYSGQTRVSAGVLALGVSGAISNQSNLLVDGGGFNLAGFNDTVGTVTITSGSIFGSGTLSGSSYDIQGGAVTAILGGSGGLTKSTSGTTVLSGINAYTGVTAVNAGTLSVNGSIAASSGVGIASGATLGGSGAVSVISGAGLVSPGNSPGILTATSIDPSTGMDFAFELTGTGSPAYGNASNSVNDVLRLTAATPALESLTTNNVVSVYFGGSIAQGDTFRGGTYVDSATTLGARDAFATAIAGADWRYYVYGNGGGSHSFNGTSYYTLGEYDSALTITRTVVADSANFGGGTVNGAVTQFVVVPEPGALALALTGVGGFMAWSARQRNRRAA
jgi:autotransporter-associated beta strand protein